MSRMFMVPLTIAPCRPEQSVADLGEPRGTGPLSKPDNYIHLDTAVC